MEQNKEYFAFISYKREDEKWAKWLQKKLESYKLPAIVRKESPGLPKYIRPIFRDGTDLSGGVLADKLRQELLRSKYLIVICSPNATKSQWVNKEAKTFIDEGRLEQIIPFIVDGTPHASEPTKECFPKALLDIPSEKELLGINVQEVGRNMAFIRLVATMLGIRFDALWQRHRRGLIRQRIIYGCIGILFCILGLFIWDYNRSTYSYFADYVDCYGVPEGVIPLTTKQVSHRMRSYQFKYNRIPFGEPGAYSWRISKVSYVNSALRPQNIDNTEMTDRSPIIEMEYNEKTGVVSRINFCDTKGKVLLRHVLTERDGSTAAVADFVDSQEQRGTGFVGANLSSITNRHMYQKSSIVRYVYERDERGHIVRQTYHANNDYQLQRSATSDANGIFGRSFTLDSLGRRLKVEYLGLEGVAVCTKNGVAGRLYEYGVHGNIQKTTYVNSDGKPTLNEELWAIYIAKDDEWGNMIETEYHGTDGNLCLSNSGIAKLVCKYDDRGNRIEEAYFGTDSKPCIEENGGAKWVNKYDDQGNIIEMACFGLDGKPCTDNEGGAKWVKKYDDQGNEIETACFDIDGKPCMDIYGIAKWVGKYDNKGNRIEITRFDTNGNLCMGTYGYAKWVGKYDDRGKQVEIAFYGTDGKPCQRRDGNAKWIRKYDNRGNIIEEAYFGTDGKPCLNVYGHAKWVGKYNDNGNLIEVAYFDTDGNPCLADEGYAKLVYKYDDRGNLIEETCFDSDGKPCLNSHGYFKYSTIYDSWGYPIDRTMWGTSGEPVESMGYHRMLTSYDKFHRETEVTYYNKDNLMISQKVSSAIVLSVNGMAQKVGIPLQSILLQWNDWIIGATWEELSFERERSRYGEKCYYFITPDGNIKQLHIESGLAGISFQHYAVEKSQAKEWMKLLDDWKRKHQ